MQKDTIEKQERKIARPLKQLVSLIKADLAAINDIQMESIRTVAEMLQPIRVAIGEKLIEAKPQVKHGSFKEWVSATFPVLGHRSATEYMRMAEEQKRTGVLFSGPQHFRRHTQAGYKKNPTGTANWRNDVQAHVNSFKPDQFAHDERDRREEKRLIVKLALEIISIGYKVLATKLHPDKGGSSEGMQRLNDARDLLKGCVE